jgi:hypothetical protein
MSSIAKSIHADTCGAPSCEALQVGSTDIDCSHPVIRVSAEGQVSFSSFNWRTEMLRSRTRLRIAQSKSTKVHPVK